MTFGGFAQILNRAFGCQEKGTDFIITLSKKFMDVPLDKRADGADESVDKPADKPANDPVGEQISEEDSDYYPFDKMEENTLSKIFRGKEPEALSKKSAAKMLSKMNRDQFEAYLGELYDGGKEQLIKELKEAGEEIDEGKWEESCTDVLISILTEAAKRKRKNSKAKKTQIHKSPKTDLSEKQKGIFTFPCNSKEEMFNFFSYVVKAYKIDAFINNVDPTSGELKPIHMDRIDMFLECVRNNEWKPYNLSAKKITNELAEKINNFCEQLEEYGFSLAGKFYAEPAADGETFISVPNYMNNEPEIVSEINEGMLLLRKKLYNTYRSIENFVLQK